MDNQNNPNFPNNTPNPSSPTGTPPQPLPTATAPILSSADPTLGSNNGSIPSWPSIPQTAESSPWPSPQSAPNTTQQDQVSSWAPPVQSPIQTTVASNIQPTPAWSPDPISSPASSSSNAAWTPPTQPITAAPNIESASAWTSTPPPPASNGQTTDTTPMWSAPQTIPTPPSLPTAEASTSPWPSSPQSAPNTTQQDQISSWAPPVQAETTSPQSEQTPTFTPPTATTPLSPLDNPWGSPARPPTIDGSQSPASNSTQPSWMGINTAPADSQTTSAPASPLESAPTDLSHLITNNDPSEHQPTPETLVVPSATVTTPNVPTLPTENHKSIPKWLIGLGAGLLILVFGASAYFILGIGQPSKETTSLPATTTSQTSELKPPLPAATAIPTAKPANQSTENGSANFGELGGSAGASPAATSAADLLQQGQP